MAFNNNGGNSMPMAGLGSLLNGFMPGGQGGAPAQVADLLRQQLLVKQRLAKELGTARSQQPAGMMPNAPTPPMVPMPTGNRGGTPLTQPLQVSTGYDSGRQFSKEGSEDRLREQTESYRGLPSTADEPPELTQEEIDQLERMMTPTEREDYINSLIQEIDELYSQPETEQTRQRIEEIQREVERLRAE